MTNKQVIEAFIMELSKIKERLPYKGASEIRLPAAVYFEQVAYTTYCNDTESTRLALTVEEHYVLLISYEQVIAIGMIINGSRIVIITDEKFSNTTTRHCSMLSGILDVYQIRTMTMRYVLLHHRQPDGVRSFRWRLSDEFSYSYEKLYELITNEYY